MSERATLMKLFYEYQDMVDEANGGAFSKLCCFSA